MRARSLAVLGLMCALPLLGGCAGAIPPHAGTYPAATPPAPPTARAIALQAASVLIPYHDPRHTFELGRPQTWVALDARSNPQLARALGDGVRFFEPITASDPDAGSSGKLWIDVLPVRKGRTPRQVLLAPFVEEDYPPPLLGRMRLLPARLGGVAGYRLVTLAGKTQATLLLVRRNGYDYRITVFGAIVPLEVQRALDSWRFVDSAH
jgi:hypothetical protein